jgi:hypothetical protein
MKWNISNGGSLIPPASDVQEAAMARHIIMDSTGHSTIEFDKSDPVDLAEAKRRFDKLVSKCFIPAETRSEGRHHVPGKADRIFSPEAEETIFIPALKGG